MQGEASLETKKGSFLNVWRSLHKSVHKSIHKSLHKSVHKPAVHKSVHERVFKIIITGLKSFYLCIFQLHVHWLIFFYFFIFMIWIQVSLEKTHNKKLLITVWIKSHNKALMYSAKTHKIVEKKNNIYYNLLCLLCVVNKNEKVKPR